MHRFIDVDIMGSGVMELCHPDDPTVGVAGAYITTHIYHQDEEVTTFFSKEDLLHLLKLIEETN